LAPGGYVAELAGQRLCRSPVKKIVAGGADGIVSALEAPRASTARTIVAETARPTCFIDTRASVVKIEKTTTITIAAPLTETGGGADAVCDPVFSLHATVAGLALAAEDEHLVVDRESEEDEPEERSSDSAR
jgi:hypothetical protein